MPSIKVIIPVYNAFDDTVICIDSVIQHGGFDQLIIIDDASPNGIFSEYYKTNNSKLLLIRNENNLGFTGTVNKGIELAEKADVILLNSDTVVTKNWIEKLAKAAYSSDKIATVTPLTNNGTICSYPNFCEDNQLVEGVSLETIAEIVESSSANAYPELPTCVGFCTYVKRSVIDKIGSLDVETFGRGYGEENDFSRRAVKAGYTNILDDSTFIHHKGSLSFSMDKNELLVNNYKKLCLKHPEYHSEVHKFIGNDPIKKIRDKITKRFFKTLEYPLILHILHNDSKVPLRHHFGGTEIHVSDLIDHTRFIHGNLVFYQEYYYLSLFYSNLKIKFKIPKNIGFHEILNQISPNLIHLHHLGDLPIGYVSETLSKFNYVLSLHDFNFISPVAQLYLESKGNSKIEECYSASGLDSNEMKSRVGAAKELLDSAKRIIYFSESTRNIFKSLFDLNDNTWIRVRHPVEHFEEKLSPILGDDFKVLLLGSISGQKGINQLAELVQCNQISDKKISWHVLGRLQRKLPNIKDWGIYDRKDLLPKIKEIKPNLILIPSQWPETYCMTADEAWSAGIPVLTTPIGGPPERINSFGGGYVSESLSSESILIKLEEIISNPDEYNKIVATLKTVPLESYKTFKLFYEHIYCDCIDPNRHPNYDIYEKYLVDNFSSPKIRFLMKIKLMIIKVLDFLGIKEAVKKLVRKFI